MDALRAQMVRQGYHLDGLTPRERERVWYSLASKRRRPQLAALLGADEDEIDALVARVRKERAKRHVAKEAH
jgi:DNA-binding CsgD family transcriptional regulator